MQIYTTIQKGEGHPVFCEDFLWTGHLENNWFIGAVMDGCSSGKDSHFASALLGKILGKIRLLLADQKEINLRTASSAVVGEYFARNLFENFTNTINYLGLNYIESLSTIILMIYHLVKKEVWIMTSGDGYVAIDKKITRIDQNNRPDYLAYHLNKGFAEWFKNHVQIFQNSHADRVAISTDGIGSFFSMQSFVKADIDTATELLASPIHHQKEQDAKIDHFYAEFGLIPYDDVCIIRIDNE